LELASTAGFPMEAISGNISRGSLGFAGRVADIVMPPRTASGESF